MSNNGLCMLNQAVALFRDLDPEMPAQTVQCFLLVALTTEDVPMRDLQEGMGMSSASTSRNVAYLSE